MKESKHTENNISLKTLILQLQLSLEISQMQEIFSIYSELLLLFTYFNKGENLSSKDKKSIGTIPTNSGLSGKENLNPSYDQIMNELYGVDLTNGIPDEFVKKHTFEYIFTHTLFDKNNPLNQLVLDRALGIKSNEKSTVSCQTTALLNAYAFNTKTGITGHQILNVLNNADGSFNDNIYSDGSPKNLYGLSKDIATELKMDKMIVASDNKMIPPSILADLSLGAIAGLTKGNGDQHFVYKNWNVTVDSLNHQRTEANNYTINSYRILHWNNIE